MSQTNISVKYMRNFTAIQLNKISKD